MFAFLFGDVHDPNPRIAEAAAKLIVKSSSLFLMQVLMPGTELKPKYLADPVPKTSGTECAEHMVLESGYILGMHMDSI